MPSEQIRQQLMLMLEVLDKSLKTIHPDKIKVENNALRQKIVEAYHNSKARDHQRILGRHKIIEERKEYLEKLNIHREAEEARKTELALREQQKLEEDRLKQERDERERQRTQEQLREIQKKHIEEKMQQIAQTDIGKKVLGKLDEKELAELDTDAIMIKQVEELENEKRQLMARLKSQEKKVNTTVYTILTFYVK
jgi:translation initiation factor 3 subunit A